MVKFGYFATFWQFSQKRSDNVCISFVFNLGMMLIKCEEMDFIEFFKRFVRCPTYDVKGGGGGKGRSQKRFSNFYSFLP